jgi:hypothetical protein
VRRVILDINYSSATMVYVQIETWQGQPDWLHRHSASISIRTSPSAVSRPGALDLGLLRPLRWQSARLHLVPVFTEDLIEPQLRVRPLDPDLPPCWTLVPRFQLAVESLTHLRVPR